MNYNGAYYPPQYAAPVFKGLSPAEYGEKKSLQRASNAIGAAFLLLNAVSIAGMLLAMAVLLVSGMPYMDAALFLQEPGMLWLLQVVLSVTMFTVPFMIAAAIMRVRVSDIIPMRKVEPSLFVPLVMVGLGVCMLGNFATNLFAGTISIFGIVPNMPDIENPSGPFGGMLLILGSAFAPALVEEFALRGVVMGSLRRFGDGFAIFVSSALFGLMHGNLVQTPFAFVVGLGLGYVVVASGSMWTSVTVHFINNFLATVLNDLMTGASPSTSNLINILYGLAALIIGVIGAIWLICRRPAAFRLNRSGSAFSAGRRFGIFLATPCMIITLILFAATMVLAQFT